MDNLSNIQNLLNNEVQEEGNLVEEMEKNFIMPAMTKSLTAPKLRPLTKDLKIDPNNVYNSRPLTTSVASLNNPYLKRRKLVVAGNPFPLKKSQSNIFSSNTGSGDLGLMGKENSILS
mgnify:CR=1 FL=1